jgi:hypothetical protein
MTPPRLLVILQAGQTDDCVNTLSRIAIKPATLDVSFWVTPLN